MLDVVVHVPLEFGLRIVLPDLPASWYLSRCRAAKTSDTTMFPIRSQHRMLDRSQNDHLLSNQRLSIRPLCPCGTPTVPLFYRYSRFTHSYTLYPALPSPPPPPLTFTSGRLLACDVTSGVFLLGCVLNNFAVPTLSPSDPARLARSQNFTERDEP